MNDISKALAPDAPVVMNENGGKQSDTPYGFHMLPISSIFAAAEVAQYGAKKYGESFDNRNYTKIPAIEHVNHALQHLYGYLAGDKSDDHLAHAIVRCMFAYDVDQKEDKKAEEAEVKPNMNTNPSCKSKEDIIHDVWIALRTFQHCESEHELESECWFGVDAALYLIASDIIMYTGLPWNSNEDFIYDTITDSLGELNSNIDKSNCCFYAIHDTLETYVDQLAERFLEIYKEENEDE